MKKKKLIWTEKAQHYANKNGWDLFQTDSHGLQLWSLDDPHGVMMDRYNEKYSGPKYRGLDRDTKALEAVKKAARNGNKSAKLALEIIFKEIASSRLFISKDKDYKVYSTFQKGSLKTFDNIYDWEIVGRRKSLKSARNLAAKYGQGNCPVAL